MESSQLRRISIIGISILCLSPVEFFSNKLFNESETNSIVIASNNIKLESNLLNNYEIFNPNIKTASEDIEKLASENKKKENTENDNNLESETTDEKVKEEKEEEIVDKKVEEKTSSSTTKKEVTETPKETTINEKVETTTAINQEQTKEVQAQTEVATPNTEVATALVNYALQYVGYPYKSGGTDLNTGVDCSGFTMKVYEHFGYSLSHSSKVQATQGTAISIDNIQIGDIIFYGYNGSVSHAALYIGNGQIVHAATPADGIKVASYQIMPIITVRRILN